MIGKQLAKLGVWAYYTQAHEVDGVIYAVGPLALARGRIYGNCDAFGYAKFW